MTKEREIEKEYFHQLKNTLTKSSLYIGEKIDRIDVLNMIYFTKHNFNIIDKLIKENAYTSLVNFTFESKDEGFELLEIISIKDIDHNLFIGFVVDESELFSDKYLYCVKQLKQQEYDTLLKCENHKGFYIYEN